MAFSLKKKWSVTKGIISVIAITDVINVSVNVNFRWF